LVLCGEGGPFDDGSLHGLLGKNGPAEQLTRGYRYSRHWRASLVCDPRIPLDRPGEQAFDRRVAIAHVVLAAAPKAHEQAARLVAAAQRARREPASDGKSGRLRALIAADGCRSRRSSVGGQIAAVGVVIGVAVAASVIPTGRESKAAPEAPIKMPTRKAASESPVAEMSHAKSATHTGAPESATHMAAATATVSSPTARERLSSQSSGESGSGSQNDHDLT
jgi:hypothetical protein